MAEQKSQPNAPKSHPNDSETQINASMKGKQPNTQEDAKSPQFSVEDGKVIDNETNTVVAEGEDDEELAAIAAHRNANPAPTDTAGNPVGDNEGRTATK